jgi:modulator of FtsH protease
VSAYQVTQWHEFAVAAASAAATLTGLLFVAISINLDRILEIERLPRRAAGTMMILLAILLAALFLLAPGQDDSAVGAELVATGLVLAAIAAVDATRTERTVGEPLAWTIGPIATLSAPAIALVVAGVSTALKGGGGLYWFLAAAVIGFSGAALNAWVLLVEVKR